MLCLAFLCSAYLSFALLCFALLWHCWCVAGACHLVPRRGPFAAQGRSTGLGQAGSLSPQAAVVGQPQPGAGLRVPLAVATGTGPQPGSSVAALASQPVGARHRPGGLCRTGPRREPQPGAGLRAPHLFSVVRPRSLVAATVSRTHWPGGLCHPRLRRGPLPRAAFGGPSAITCNPPCADPDQGLRSGRGLLAGAEQGGLLCKTPLTVALGAWV